MRRSIWICIGVLSVAGCGAGDDREVRAAVGDYVDALQKRDTGLTCSLLSADELAELDRQGSCEEVFAAGFELYEEEGIAIPDYEIENVEVDGPRASATLTSGSTDETLPLVREGGEWKLDGATSFADFHPDDPVP